MAETHTHGGAALRSVLTTLLILALLGAVGFLLAERNSAPLLHPAEGRNGHRRARLGAALRPRARSAPRTPRWPRPTVRFASRGRPSAERGGVRRAGRPRPAAGRHPARLGQGPARAVRRGTLTEGIAYLERPSCCETAQLRPTPAAAGPAGRGRLLRGLRSHLPGPRRAAGRRGLLKLATTGSPSHAREAADLLDRMGPALEGLLRATRGAAILPPTTPSCRRPSQLPRPLPTADDDAPTGRATATADRSIHRRPTRSESDPSTPERTRR